MRLCCPAVRKHVVNTNYRNEDRSCKMHGFFFHGTKTMRLPDQLVLKVWPMISYQSVSVNRPYHQWWRQTDHHPRSQAFGTNSMNSRYPSSDEIHINRKNYQEIAN